MFEDVRDVVGGEEDVREADTDEGSALRAFDELKRCAKYDGAGAFAADESSGEVEVVFGEELIQIKSGDAAWDTGEFCAYLIGVGVADALESGVDLAGAAARLNVGF